MTKLPPSPYPDLVAIARRALKRRRRGKIGHLPESVRHQINSLLDDGLTYAQIIARLGPAGQALNKDNLSRWRKAQYQDWRAEQLFKEVATDLPQFSPAEPAGQLVRLLQELSVPDLKEAISRNPGKVFSVLNLVAQFAEVAFQPGAQLSKESCTEA